MQLHLEIEIELELMGVMNVDENASTVTFKAAFRQWWIDPRLTWKIEDFGGVDRLWLSTEDKECWVPDTIIREDAGGSYFSDFKNTEVRIHADGTHYWTRLGELTVVASLDFKKYPYDYQSVNITIGSWLYNDKRLSYFLHENPEEVTKGLAIITKRIGFSTM
jgi:hypothetical protein